MLLGCLVCRHVSDTQGNGDEGINKWIFGRHLRHYDKRNHGDLCCGEGGKLNFQCLSSLFAQKLKDSRAILQFCSLPLLVGSWRARRNHRTGCKKLRNSICVPILYGSIIDGLVSLMLCTEACFQKYVNEFIIAFESVEHLKTFIFH